MQDMSNEQFMDLINNEEKTSIVLDTSAWLKIYTYSPKLRHDIMNAIESKHILFWIPYQVKLEIARNNQKSMNENPIRLQKEVRNLKKPIESLQAEVEQIANSMKNFGFKEHKILKETFDEHLSTLYEHIKGYELPKAPYQQKDINELINNSPLFHLNTGFSYFELMDIYKEGEFRYAHKIPPGYEDEVAKDEVDKKDKTSLTRKYGDLIIWKEILCHLVTSNTQPERKFEKNVIFVTDDKKEDFWKFNRKNSITGPRDELIDEFEQYSAGKLHLMLIEDFYKNLIASDKVPDRQQKFELEFNRFIEMFLSEREMTLSDLDNKIEMELQNTYEIEEILSMKNYNFSEVVSISKNESPIYKPNPAEFSFYFHDDEAHVNGVIYGSIQCYIDYRKFDLLGSENLPNTIIDIDFKISVDLIFDLDSVYTDFKDNLPEVIMKSFEVLDVDFSI